MLRVCYVQMNGNMSKNALYLLHPHNPHWPGVMAVLDGNHRVLTLLRMFNEGITESTGEESLLYFPSIVFHPKTPLEVFNHLVGGEFRCSLFSSLSSYTN